MKFKEFLFPLLTLIVAAIAIAVPAYVSYNLYGRGPSPEKRLEVDHALTTEPGKSASLFGSKTVLAVSVDGKAVSDLIIAYDILRNVGHAPVLPSDYHKTFL